MTLCSVPTTGLGWQKLATLHLHYFTHQSFIIGKRAWLIYGFGLYKAYQELEYRDEKSGVKSLKALNRGLSIHAERFTLPHSVLENNRHNLTTSEATRKYPVP